MLESRQTRYFCGTQDLIMAMMLCSSGCKLAGCAVAVTSSMRTGTNSKYDCAVVIPGNLDRHLTATVQKPALELPC